MPEFITTTEASQLSGYNIEYIRQLIRAGKIKAEKRGRDWWVDRENFLSYLQQSERSTDKRFGPQK
jgi:excisionase family DNA binding protein